MTDAEVVKMINDRRERRLLGLSHTQPPVWAMALVATIIILVVRCLW